MNFRLLVLGLMLNTYSTVHAVLTDLTASSETFSMSSEHMTDPASSCDLKGMLETYLKPSFFKVFMPKQEQSKLQSVKYDGKYLTMVTQKNSMIMNCENVDKPGLAVLSCRFEDKVPRGISYMKFEVIRKKTAKGCEESVSSSGAFDNWVRVKGYSPHELHTGVVLGFANYYLPPNERIFDGAGMSRVVAAHAKKK
jgi:hypothetical protein